MNLIRVSNTRLSQNGIGVIIMDAARHYENDDRKE